MKKFINRLRDKPDHHKKRFALMTSATITMAIFGVWSLVNFGHGGVLSQAMTPVENRVVVSENEVSPLQSLQMNMASAFGAFLNTFGELKDGLRFGNSELEGEFGEPTSTPSNPIEIYGQ